MGFLKSKTVWFGTAVTILGGIQVFLPNVKELIQPEMYGQIMSAIGLVIIILRSITSQPLSEK